MDDIQQVIKHSLSQDSNFNDLTISIVGVAATQKAHIEITTDQADSVILRFASPNSIGSLLGFTTDKVFFPYQRPLANPILPRRLIALLVSWCRHLCVMARSSRGRAANRPLQLIHLAAFSPASVVAFSPSNMLEVPSNIAGAPITHATFALVNQNNEDLDTLNEQWQLVIEVVW